MSETLPLPPHPRLIEYETLTKQLVETKRFHDWAMGWLESLARALGRDPRDLDVQHMLRGGVKWLRHSWERSPGTLPDARLLIANAHGSESWPKFALQVQALERLEGSPFELAADAIAGGDGETLQRLLREHPGLARQRSEREHHSTLLHYVSANGVEEFRQKTPANIVEMARLLLEAGADVNAESDAYNGRSTTLELTATSCHPQNAGVQIELMNLLLERGAGIDGVSGDSIVNACLANGRAEAAAFLAGRGARLDFAGAAGLGRLDVVQRDLDDATRPQVTDAFAWACQFGRLDVAVFLLEHGLAVDVLFRDGETGLHWAAHEGHVELVKMLLERGAPVDIIDDRFEGTPLDWARGHREIVALLKRRRVSR